MKKQLFTLFIILCAGISASAQSSSFSFQYSMGFGAGDMKDYIPNASFRGATLEWRKYVQPNITVGIEAGWNVFYKALPTDSYTAGNTTLTGKQYRYQNQVPLLAAANFFLKTDEKLKPFVGLGIGTMYSRRNTDMNLYTLESEAWHFAVRPEVGLMYSMSDATAAYLGFKYYTGLKSGDFEKSQSYFAINVGFVFGTY
ncbi:MAG TPA: outer membrane beta-barrel protein [Cyclobacteriaceae bacterium]|jgi:outer membrane protein|nr:outer membrane beta-barrel protein [Cyclobacteriaceae bacterium]